MFDLERATDRLCVFYVVRGMERHPPSQAPSLSQRVATPALIVLQRRFAQEPWAKDRPGSLVLITSNTN